MPIYEPDHVEYKISQGHVSIVLDGGAQLPAYHAHPQHGARFPGVALVHDWWGLSDIVRRMANLFAMMGHYVIAPDLFDGQRATSPKEAMALVKGLGDDMGYMKVDSALEVLENHHQCNAYVAVIGIGMGGSLAFEAAVTRDDIEAAVAYSGFPHRYLERFHQIHVPLQAYFGSDEKYITAQIIERMKAELDRSRYQHEVEIIDGLGHEFFADEMPHDQRIKSRDVLKDTLRFLDQHLLGPKKPGKKQVY